MRRGIGILIVIGITLTLSGAVCAHEPWDGYGMGYGKSVNVEAMQKFRAETLNIRDSLNSKYLELMDEYNKSELNPKRIVALRKEIIDLEEQIQTIAKKHKIPMGGMMGPGMLMGSGGSAMMQMCPMGWR